MKIGLQLPASQPVSGGGYTFEWELFRALRRQFAVRRESVVVCGQGAPPAEVEATEYLTVGKPSRTGLAAKDVLRQLPGMRRVAGVWRGVRRARREVSNNAAADAWTAALKERQVEFLLHVSPYVMTCDIPFAMVVWDLEHRRHPYFPELSEGNEFLRRERHYRETLLRAAIVITGTEVGSRELQQYYGIAPERIAVIPHPTPQDALDAGAGARLPRPTWLNASDPVILYPAQFWAHKNHVGLLAAVGRLRRSHGLRVTVVLPGSDRGNQSHVEAVARKMGLTDCVRFVGFVPRQELLAAYQHSAMLVYSSLCGPENLPPLEAFALGCPVVASDFPGSREQLGEAALLVQGTDDERLAEAMRLVLEQPGRRSELVGRGLKRAADWSPERFATTMLSYVDEFAQLRRTWA